ncbi:MAG: glycosyltransferase [Clostridia bacterium]|nr:glycosyltransferase [Clostridia bacterium]
MSKVSVSLVSYNSGGVIVGALTSLFREVQDLDLQVYVVDNASSDNTVATVQEHFPQVTVLPLSENCGFGGGHNAVLPLLDSDYHLILNPDVLFTYDALTPLCEWLDEHTDTVLVTPNVLNPDGTRQAVPRRLPRPEYMLSRPLAKFGGVFRKWRNAYTMNGSDFDGPTEISFCTGCFMLVRTAALKAVGGFDEDFFLYCEDADLSRRLAAHGRLICLPDVSVTHGWERGSSKNAALRKLHMQSMRRYFAKWRGREATAMPGERVSVAMASYNGARYIEEQLLSITAQLAAEDEVIVSDDGSTDGTIEIIDRLAATDPRIRRIDGPRAGIVANFENAMKACTGDIVFLADQDDVWHADKREAVLDKFRQTGATLVLHDARVTDGALTETAPSYFAFHGTRAGYWQNLWRNGYVGCCMAFRRELLEIALPMPTNLPMHDQWLGMLAEKRGGVALLNKPLIDYRRHESNATTLEQHGPLPEMLKNRWIMLRALTARLKK